jgi:hypothetical protein
MFLGKTGKRFKKIFKAELKIKLRIDISGG